MRFTINKMVNGKRSSESMYIPKEDYDEAVEMLNGLDAWFSVEVGRQKEEQKEAFLKYYDMKNLIFDEDDIHDSAEVIIHKDKESERYFIQLIPFYSLYYYILESNIDGKGCPRLMSLETATNVTRRLGFTNFKVSI